ncbi:MAG: 5'-nucleotidase, lipoprotein e(P4) family [Acidobacteria bacterium]|nr:5'-nucleotidase, lipoprotein e(P4) family [Acidobacteriota bacterium]MBK8147106.1 5'-nucleotidase, lipoprotein e(P4) family [Acidobacteriota bacterium]MBK8812337.1 5'-nucleotidase, lipoprotein e(P4) family [Acidobacteriota bacterium]
MKHKHYLLSFSLTLISVVSMYFTAGQSAQQQPAVQQSQFDYQTGATLFMQKSAEYRALCYQAFNWARRSLADDVKTAKKLAKAERRKPRAVVVDIDETMLDNSPAQAAGIKTNTAFNQKDWAAWTSMRKAKAIPGAVDFANFAKASDVRIFYVSNRDETEKQATIDNLKAVGFPDISDETVMLRQKESTKEPRRVKIAETYRIVILMGDNLNDLANYFEKKSVADRFAETDRVKELWGSRFIVLPNAMYGEWEGAIYEYQRLTESQKAEKRAAALELP